MSRNITTIRNNREFNENPCAKQESRLILDIFVMKYLLYLDIGAILALERGFQPSSNVMSPVSAILYNKSIQMTPICAKGENKPTPQNF